MSRWIAWMDRNRTVPEAWYANDGIEMTERAQQNPAAYFSKRHIVSLEPSFDEPGRTACGREIPEDNPDNIDWCPEEAFNLLGKCKHCLRIARDPRRGEQEPAS